MHRASGVMLAIAAFVFVPAVDAQEAGRIRVITDVTVEGLAGRRWLAMLRQRLPDSSYQALAHLARPLGDRERRWEALIRARSESWEHEIAGLAETYAPVHAPDLALVVLGNRGGEDAFVHDGTTIGFDLAALNASYGDPDEPENLARIDRFFRHEYVHLLQKAWLARLPAPGARPLDLAIMDMWSEGLGNYYSLSPRWRAPDGSLTSHAKAALERLEPRLVVRLAALACTSPAGGVRLASDLSTGPFAEKWGALPTALWLAAEEAESEGALRRLVLAGPDGVWALAERRLAPALRAVLMEIRAAAARCDPPARR